ncbi:MAG TPA: NAD(P)/FAD-dependent oxidoreductase [Blastocatellia bacterium]|nr:NAD(P)/FAD-dependent oxidoreductase [Blastocatellia bacterium]
MKIENKEPGKKTVVVLGGGFAGLNAAKQLANEPDVFVILIDQRNHHLFQPLLYQVATAGLSPGDIAVPIRSQFAHTPNVQVHWGEVTAVDLKEQVVKSSVSDLKLKYDYLVLACGARHSYFGHPEWEEYAPGLKTLEQAIEIRRRILSAFENAENEPNPEKQKALLNFVVVGGGPTGVELAGAIADISRTVLVNDFRRIDPSSAKVILVEMLPRLLAPFDEELAEKAKRDLTELGVEVRTSARVERIDNEGVQIGKEFIPSKSVLWAAGVQAASLEIEPPVDMDRAGRIKVNSDLSLPGYENVFVVGDMAAVELVPGKIVPGLAPAAMQEGRHAAKVILSSVRGKGRPAFQYIDKGQMATIGKYRAVMESGRLKMSGRLAWLAWLFVHVFYLIGFKNRVAVMAQWAWSYLFSKRGARLITETQWKLKD